MHQKSLVTLEYPKIIERLTREAAFSASKALAQQLTPSDDPREVRRRLALTTEARRLMEQRPDVGVRGARDVRPHVHAAERGAMLAPAELIEVLVTLRASAHLGKIIARLDGSYPLLKALAEDAVAERGAGRDTGAPAARKHRTREHGSRAHKPRTGRDQAAAERRGGERRQTNSHRGMAGDKAPPIAKIKRKKCTIAPQRAS